MIVMHVSWSFEINNAAFGADLVMSLVSQLRLCERVN